VVGGSLALAGCSGNGDGGGSGSTSFRLAYTVPAESNYGEFVRDFKSRVTEADDSITIETFPSGELGTPSELVQGVQSGNIDMSLTDPSAIFPDRALALKFPYIYGGSFDKLVRVTDVTTSPIMDELNDSIVEESGTRILGNVILGMRNVTMKETEVLEPADLEGKNLRAADIPLFQELARGLGGNPTPVNPADISTALSTGTVDGVQLPIPTLTSFSLQDTVSYSSETNHMIHHDPLIINNDAWDGLSEDQQEIFNDATQEALSQHVTRSKRFEREARSTLEEGGVEFLGPSDGLQRSKFEESVLSRFTERWPDLADLVERIRNF
jgi:TRAP-type C4-dicarboxylate transport system substrate-binding protein